MKINLIEKGYINNRECIILSHDEDNWMDDVFYIDMWWWLPLIMSIIFLIGIGLFALFTLISPFLLILWVPLAIFLAALFDQLT